MANKKEDHDASKLFKQVKEKVEKIPKIMITDGSHSYSEAHKKEFWTTRILDLRISVTFIYKEI